MIDGSPGNTFRAVYLKEGCTEAEVKVIDDDGKAIHKLIECYYVDMVRRFIENREFVFIVDGCGLLKAREPTVFSPIRSDGRASVMLAGSVIITGMIDPDDESFRDLTNEEIQHIERNIRELNGHAVIVNTTYRPAIW